MDNRKNDYFIELIKITKLVFNKYPSLKNHFAINSWLQGALGNPISGIVFLAENPSLTQIERAQGRRGSSATPAGHRSVERPKSFIVNMYINPKQPHRLHKFYKQIFI
jgi:hypothetical protein